MIHHDHVFTTFDTDQLIFLGIPDLNEKSTIEVLRDRSQVALSDYINYCYPDHTIRFGKLLLLFGRIQRIRSSLIENIFFKDEIGGVPITTVIQNMFAQS